MTPNITADSVRKYLYKLLKKGYTSELIDRKINSLRAHFRLEYAEKRLNPFQFHEISETLSTFEASLLHGREEPRVGFGLEHTPANIPTDSLQTATHEAGSMHAEIHIKLSVEWKRLRTALYRNLSRIPLLSNLLSSGGRPSRSGLTIGSVAENALDQQQNAEPQISRRFIGGVLLLLFASILGGGLYTRFFQRTASTLAYPSTPVVGNRVLSFQGRLTDSLGNPITASTNMRFRLYDASSGGSTLYDSGTCSIAPDQDGIHNVLIGSSCGSAIGSSVFTENADVWLGVTVGSDSEMTPRQQVANVPYAFNSETLQGLPLGRTASTVPYINDGGDVLIAAASPQIGSTFASQTFVVSSANSVTVQAAGTGDVSLTATGSGELKFLTGGAQVGVFNNSGNLGVGVASPTSFKVQVAGDVGPNTDSAYDLGSASLAWRNVYADAFVGTITPGFTQGSVIFTDGSGNLAQDNAQFFFDDTNNKFGIGTASPVGKLHVTGAATGKALAIFNETGNQNILTASASGTTVANLDRSGNLAIEGSLSDLSGATLNVDDSLSIAGSTTLGDASGDTVTSNAAAWTFANDTTVALSGGVNGLNFDSNTLSIDATNNRIGIGTAAPDTSLEVTGKVIVGGDGSFNGSEYLKIAGLTSQDVWTNLAGSSNGIDEDMRFITGIYGQSTDMGFFGMATWHTLEVRVGNTGQAYFTTDGRFGMGTSGPDAKIDSLSTSGEQLRLTYADGSAYTGFTVSSGGDLTLAATGGDFAFTDTSNTLAQIKDQGAYPFLNIAGKTDTGDPATCAEGDLYYNASDDTIKVCHTSNSWEALDGGGSGTPEGSDTQFQYNDGGVFGGTAALTYNDSTLETTITDDLTLTFAGTENLGITSDLAGTVNVLNITGTPSGSAGTAYGLYIDQADSANSNGFDASLVIDNSDTNLAIADGILFSSAGGGFTDFIDTPSSVFKVDGSGNITGVGATLTGDLAVNGDDITSDGTLTIDAATDINLDADGADIVFLDGGATVATFTNSSTDLTLDIAGGDLILANADVLNIGGNGDDVAFSAIGDDTANAGNVNSDNDLYIEDDLEVDGTIFGNVSGTITPGFTAGSVVFAGSSGELAQDNASLFFDDTNNKFGIGTASPVGKLHVTGAVTGKALAIFNETGDQDIIAASASGNTRFRVTNDGTIHGGYFLDLSNTDYGIDPAGTTNFGGYSVKVTGGALLAADSGNVGIGDLTPDAKLNILATTEQLRLDYNDSNYSSFTVSSGGDLTIAPTGADTNVTGSLNVDGSADDIQLLVQGNATQTSNLAVFENSAGTDQITFTNTGGAVFNSGQSGTGDFNVKGGSLSDLFYVDANQDRIGIGTDSPSETLHLQLSSNNKLLIESTASYAHLILDSATGQDSTLIFNEANSEVANIHWDGTPNILNLDSSTDISLDADGADVIFKDDGTTFATFTNSSTDLTLDIAGGDLILANADVLNIGGNGDDVAFSAIGDDTANAGNVNSDNDLYIEDDLEVDGTIFGNVSGTITPGFTAGSVVFAGSSGELAQDNASLFFDDTNNKFGIGTASPVGKLHVTGAVTGKALAIFNETGDQNILTASASGTTVANLDRSGNLAIEGALSDLSGATLDISDNLDVSGTLTSGTADAFTVNATGNITTSGTTGLTFSSTGGIILTGGTIADGTDGVDIADDLEVTGNTTLTGDLAVNGDDITSDGNLTLSATGYTRIGDTASPGSASGDDDLFVEGDIEVDGVLYLDGTLDTSFTAGSIVFAGTSGVLSQDNTNFFWDDSSNELGLGDTTPDAFLDITGTTEQLRLSYETGDTNYASFTLSSGGDLTIAPTGADTNVTGSLNIDGSADDVQLFVQGHSSQSNYIVLVENSAGTDRFRISDSGDTFIDGTLAVDGGLIETPTTMSLGSNGTYVRIGSSGTPTYVDGFDDDLYVVGELEVGSNAYLVGDLAVNGDDITSDGTLTIDAATDINLDADGADIVFKDGGATVATFTNSSTDLTLDIAGGQLILADADVFNIGGLTGVAYNAISDSGTTSHSLASDDDLYVEGDVEVDGTLFADGAITAVGTVTGGDFACTDCLDFAELEDTLDLDTTLVLNQSSNIWTQNFTGTSTTGYTYNADSLTTGIGSLYSFDALSSGTGISLTSTSTALTSGNLLSLDWSPGSATTATSDLFKINLGANGNVSSLLNVTDASSSLFKVTETTITNALPTEFTAAGDLSLAYDLQFTNQTASYIKSNASLTLETGESHESNNLTLRTYNGGNIIMNVGNNVGIGTGSSPSAKLDVEGEIQLDIDTANDTTIGVCKDLADGNTDVKFRECSSTPGDIAEYYEAESGLLPGHVVSLGNNNGSVQAQRSSSAYDAKAYGIVSTFPVGQHGKPLAHKTIPQGYFPTAIGLVGKVPTYVSTTNGPIQPGDPLTTSTTPGVAMKATQAGQIIGYALESYDGSVTVSSGVRTQEQQRASATMTFNADPVDPTDASVGKILVFVNPGYNDPHRSVLVNNAGNVEIRGAGGSVIADLGQSAGTINTAQLSLAGRLGVGTTAPDGASGKVIDTSTGAYLSQGGVWTNVSDVNSKENFSTIDSSEILEKIAQLDITQWNYKAESDSVKHIGPTAQDFYRTFGLGDSEKRISTIDPAGVALAGIKGLYEKVSNISVLLDVNTQAIAQLQQETARLAADTRAVIQDDTTSVTSFITTSLKATTAQISTLFADSIESTNVRTSSLTAQKANVTYLATENVTSKNASVSGTLAAGTIIADDIDSQSIRDLRSRLEKLATDNTQVQVTPEELEKEIAQVQQYITDLTQEPAPQDIAQADTYQIVNESLPVEPGSNENIFGSPIAAANIESLTVTGTSSMATLAVADAFTAGNIYIQDSSVLSLTSELKLGALEQVNIMNGGVIITADGTIRSKGEVIAEKGIRSNTVRPLHDGDDISVVLGDTGAHPSGAEPALRIQDTSGTSVAHISASGSAQFKNLALDAYTEATTSAVVVAARDNYRQTGMYAPAIQTNAAATGNGILPQGQNDIIVYNESLTKNSVVNLTATSSTQNQSLYVQKVEACLDPNNHVCHPYFKVALDGIASKDITFNWFILN